SSGYRIIPVFFQGSRKFQELLHGGVWDKDINFAACFFLIAEQWFEHPHLGYTETMKCRQKCLLKIGIHSFFLIRVFNMVDPQFIKVPFMGWRTWVGKQRG